jgi:dTDP-4-amino-4,6-dideoxygalactose transaminase
MVRIPLIRPYITEEVKAKVLEVLDSGYLTEGPVAHELEAAFRQYIGCRHAIAVTSCTTGLELALRCLGIGPGDEVIVPDYTYPATASVVAIVGARAVIVDCAPRTMLIDYDAAEAAIGPRTKAIIPVSLFGNPLDAPRLEALRSRYGVKIVEDAACSIGAEYAGKKVGALADITVFSLHPRKFITTGEGGIVTTDRDDWAAWMESYKHFGMGKATDREGIVFERIGTNLKLSNLQAAVGVVQMRHVEELLTRRRSLAAQYTERLARLQGVTLPVTTERGVHSYQSFCVFVPERDRLLSNLRRDGIEVQIGTYALHRHPAYQQGAQIDVRGPMSGSSAAFETCLALPLFHDMTNQEQDQVVGALHEQLSAVSR